MSAESKEKDPLLEQLGTLPRHAPSDAAAEKRTRAVARAAFVRAFDDEPWHRQMFGSVGRVAMPAVLASVVGIYMMWAIGAATALFH
jgi:hypothetical protein